MLREFQLRDAPELFPLLERYFPREQALLGWDPGAFQQLVDRLFRLDARFVLGILRLLGRPVFRFFVIEADGQLAGTAVLTFASRAGWVSTVTVDAPYRRRGHARRLVSAAAGAARSAGKHYLVLDVLADNLPARELYRSMGFRTLRTKTVLVREAAQETFRAPDGGVRRLRRRDGRPLAELARQSLPPTVAEVLPTDRHDFFVPTGIVRGLRSATEAWVIATGGAAEGFVRATASDAMSSGHLTAPLLSPTVGEAAANALVDRAISWATTAGKRRLLAEVPDTNRQGRAALERSGFHEAYHNETLYLPL